MLKRFLYKTFSLHIYKYATLYRKFRQYSMVPGNRFKDNLRLADKFQHIEGCVVECGVWKGGMIAAIAKLYKKNSIIRNYYLFDSFEGLPPAKEIDGIYAINWQKNIEHPNYADNCKADEKYARKAMELSGTNSFYIIKGWFEQTIPNFDFKEKIAVLRLDGDWYESTMICLKYLFPLVNNGGVIIIDDYDTWEGCSKAVHDYLSETKSKCRISFSPAGVCYIIKSS